MPALVELCERALALDPADAPQDVARKLRLQLLSTSAATTVAAGSEDARPIVALAETRPGDLTVAPDRDPMDVEGALAASAALCSADAYDDWLLTARPGPSVWTAWLTAAELGRSWDDAFRVQLAVNEVLTRLGGATLPGVREGRSRVWLHAAGSALATAMSLGLSAEQTANAVATALAAASRPHRTLELGGPHLAAVGDAVLAGRRYAFLAARGLQGPVDCLDDGADLVGRLSAGRPLRRWLTGMGTAWLSNHLTFGITAGGPLTAAAVEALLEVLAAAERETGSPLEPADVLRIEVEATVLTCARARHFEGRHDDPATPAVLSPALAQRSLRQALRVALTHRRFTPRELRLDALGAAIGGSPDLIRRIHVHHEWAMSLKSWDALRSGLGGDLLLEGLGPKGIARLIAGRTGGMGWMELPFALAADALQGATGTDLRELPGELADDPGAMLARGVQAAADWAAKRMERLLLGAPLPGQEEPAEAPGTFDLGSVPWADFAMPLPARVRVLLHGGRVHEAERSHPLGSPGRPPEETLHQVRAKWMDARPATASEQGWSALFSAVLGADGAPAALQAGPREFLARLRPPV